MVTAGQAAFCEFLQNRYTKLLKTDISSHMLPKSIDAVKRCTPLISSSAIQTQNIGKGYDLRKRTKKCAEPSEKYCSKRRKSIRGRSFSYFIAQKRSLGKTSKQYKTHNVELTSSNNIEPASIAKWLSTMKPLIAPLSPENSSTDTAYSEYTAYSERSVRSIEEEAKPTTTWLKAEKLSTVPLFLNSSTNIALKPNITYSVKEDTYQTANYIESVLPDITETTIKQSPRSSPIYPQEDTFDTPEDLSQSAEQKSIVDTPPPSYIDYSPDWKEESCKENIHFSEMSHPSCRLVKLNINSPKQINRRDPTLFTNEPERVHFSSESDTNRNETEEEKRSRITIEIEAGGECIIFLPVDHVEYRVKARNCPNCCNSQEGTSTGKPSITYAYHV